MIFSQHGLRGLLAIAALVALGMIAPARAQNTIPEEFDKIIQQRSRISALSDDLFGDHVDLSSGSLEIIQTDIDLPGSNALPVRVGRRMVAATGFFGTGHFGVMDLDIPNLHGMFSSGTSAPGWLVDASNAIDMGKRCSHFAAPPYVTYQGGLWSPDEYWHGSSFYLPGSGDQELLGRLPDAHIPNDGNAYPILMKGGAAVRCLSELDVSGTGEGFEIVMPDGTVYVMKHMVSRNVEGIKKSDPFPTLLSTTAKPAARSSGTQTSGVIVQPQVATNYVLQRNEVLIYPTEVRDRFGNTVTYTWSASNPWRLLQISANDGRHLDFSYSSTDAASYQILSVSDGARTWNYSAGMLTQPDGGVWTWNLTALHNAKPFPSGVFCDYIAYPNLNKTYTGTITAPSGATVLYTMNPALFGRSWAPRECTPGEGGALSPGNEPYLIDRVAMTSKKITGPGLPGAGLTWTYAYGPPNHCWDASTTDPEAVICTAASPSARTTTVTAPDGAVSRHTYGNRFDANEGLLLQQEFGWNGSTAIRTVTYEYADAEAAPYAAYNGHSVRNRGDYYSTSMIRPVQRIVTAQQGRSFIWQVGSDCSGIPYCFDQYARPTKVVKNSAPSP